MLASLGLENLDRVLLDIVYREAYDAPTTAGKVDNARMCHPRAVHARGKARASCSDARGIGIQPASNSAMDRWLDLLPSLAAEGAADPVQKERSERSRPERTTSPQRMAFSNPRVALAPPLAMGSDQPSFVGGWVTLRGLFLKRGALGLFVLLISLWTVLTTRTQSPRHSIAADIIAKLTVLCAPPLFILSGIALTAHGQPRPRARIALGCCLCVTIQCMHRVYLCHETARQLGGWGIEQCARAFVVIVSTSIVYAITALVFLRGLQPWHAYRLGSVLAISVGFLGSLTLRILLGPDVECPPLSTSFPLSALFYSESLLLVLACGPSNRRRLLELMTVISLDQGVELMKATTHEDEEDDAVSASLESSA